MAEPTTPGSSPDPQLEPVVEAPRRRGIPVMSAVWLVPILALAVSLGVAWRNYSERGDLIEIRFDSASGIVAGETELRFRDFTIGVVEELDFTEDLSQVIARVRLQRGIQDHVDDDAQFWLVRAQVGPRGITGLETVLSGAYIEATFDNVPGRRTGSFVALPKPPPTPAGQPGLRIRLRAPDGGSLAAGAPILFKQIPVGEVEDVALTPEGEVLLTAFVEAPNHERLTTATRFWNASGFTVELGAAGAALRVDSIASLVQGGLAFDTITSGGDPAVPNQLYQLFPNETVARDTALAEADTGEPVLFSAAFDGSIRGLSAGADVEYRGVRVGEVTAIQARVVQTPAGPEVRLEATLAVIPSRFGIPADADPIDATLDLFEAEVASGLRARLAAAGLINPTLHVELVQVPDAPAATLDRAATPHPLLPSAPSAAGDLVASAGGLMQRVAALPLEEVVDNALTLLASANRLINDEGVRAAPENLGLLLADLRALVSESGIREVPAEITAILAAARTIVDEIAAEQVAADLAATLATATTTLESVGATADGIPALLEEMRALVGQARALPLEEVVASATGLVDEARALVRSDATAELPAEAVRTLAEVRTLLSDIRAGGVIENASTALASVRTLSDDLAAARLGESLRTTLAAAEAAATNVNSASEDLPELVGSLTRLSERAGELPLEELVSTGSRVLATADTFLASEGVEAVPPRLAAALEELRGILADLREGGAVANLNTTLDSADRAADAVTEAAAQLPAIASEISALVARADAVLATVGPNSAINRDTLLLLGEARAAARSVNALVTALERRPNSVLFGR